MDEPATAQALAAFVTRGLHCGALDEAEVVERPAWAGGHSTRWPASPARHSPRTADDPATTSTCPSCSPSCPSSAPGRGGEQGFDAIEFWWPFPVAVPGDADIDGFARRSRMPASSSSASTSSPATCPAGTAVWCPGRRGRRSSATTSTSRWHSDTLGCRAFNALYGNRVDGPSAQEQDDLAAENLALAAKAAAAVDASCWSSRQRRPALPAAQSGRFVAVIDRVQRESGADNLRLLFDIYHLSVNGDDVDAAIECTRIRIGHVQIADGPQRAGHRRAGSRCLPVPAGGGGLRRLCRPLEYKPSGASVGWLPRERRGRRRS